MYTCEINITSTSLSEAISANNSHILYTQSELHALVHMQVL